jgi:hypothetical protein
MIRCQLECDPRCGVVFRHHDPVVTPVGHGEAQKLRIELGERSWVGTVDDHMVKATNHAANCAIRCCSRERPPNGYEFGSDGGSPNQGRTLFSKRVRAQIRSAVRVRTKSPTPWLTPVASRT